MKIWPIELLNEYKEGRSELKEAVKALNDEIERDKTDKRILSSAIRDMDFSIEWLETGWMPQRTKEINLTNYYWDDSLGGFVHRNSYKDPFQEVEDKIDRELELKRNAGKNRRERIDSL